MQPRLEATHFIEQYNIKPEFIERGAKRVESHTHALPLSYLPSMLGYTSKHEILHTVAVFFIKPKN